jgi:ABC-2 type transport system permease protein
VPRLAFVTQASPTILFVSLPSLSSTVAPASKVVWPLFEASGLIGGLFFSLALLRFRSVAAASS